MPNHIGDHPLSVGLTVNAQVSVRHEAIVFDELVIARLKNARVVEGKAGLLRHDANEYYLGCAAVAIDYQRPEHDDVQVFFRSWP